jgi:hypothetical protein
MRAVVQSIPQGGAVENPSSIIWGVILVFALVVVNAFFVAAEYALVRVRRARGETLAAQGSGLAKVVLHGLNHLNWIERHIPSTPACRHMPATSTISSAFCIYKTYSNMSDNRKQPGSFGRSSVQCCSSQRP